jgi:hypothetical protein
MSPRLRTRRAALRRRRKVKSAVTAISLATLDRQPAGWTVAKPLTGCIRGGRNHHGNYQRVVKRTDLTGGVCA